MLIWLRYALVGLMFIVIHQSQAVPNHNQTPVPEIQTTVPSHVRWTMDNQFVVFDTTNATPHDINAETWQAYNVRTGSIEHASNMGYPSNVFVDPQRNNTVQAAIPSFVKWMPYATSPQGHFLLVMEPVGEVPVMDVAQFDGFNPILVDTTQSQAIRLDQPPIGLPDVFWSDDEDNLVLSSIMGDFVNSFTWTTHLTANQRQAVTFPIDAVRDGQAYLTVTDVFDMAENGEQILLRVKSNDSVQATALVLFDGKIPANSHLLLGSEQPQSIHAAEFSPVDETKILLLVDAGLFEYDMTAQTMRPLETDTLRQPDDLGSQLKDAAAFSPDGRILASYGVGSFYLTNLTDFLKAPATSPNLLPKAAGITRLWLTVDCPTNAAKPITWTVHNPNNEPVSITWGTAFNVSTEVNQVVIPGSSGNTAGIATFQTKAVAGTDNRAEILVDSVLHYSRTCFIPRTS